MPVKLIVCVGASSFTEMLLTGSIVGGSFTGFNDTVKVRVTILFEVPPSFAVTVMLAVPKAFATGVNVRVPVAFGVT